MNPLEGPSIINTVETKPSGNPIPRRCVQPSASTPGLPCVRTDDLIGKDREIMIDHDGVYYRLRITRANKLILTK